MTIDVSVDLSPPNWDQAARDRVEALEKSSLRGAPATVTVTGAGGVVSATISPLAVHAGIETLAQGGNAADAAVAVALTGVATALGAYASYAGIVSVVYYEAKTGKVHALDGGFNSYLGEHDPLSIPNCDFGAMPVPIIADAPRERLGRKTLVPGFMAGLESLHQRFGRLRFGDLFAPAIWYAEEGLELDAGLATMFQTRANYLDRTEEGRAFFYQSDGSLPVAGDTFRQPETAKTLRAVAEQGCAYMYTGAWGEAFVRTVQREGGKVTAEDMARYQPTWAEPLTAEFYGAQVNTVSGRGGVELLTGLAMIEAARLEEGGLYWEDPEAFLALSRVAGFAISYSVLKPALVEALKAHGVTPDAVRPMTRDEAEKSAPVILSGACSVPADKPSHSDSLVVIDKDGNVAAMTHTINCVTWGDTGIVVGGVPLPDAAGFQQSALAAIQPGDRLPHAISPVIVLTDGKPALAAAQVGSCMLPEALRLMLGLFGQNLNLAALQAKPPLLVTFPGISTTDGEEFDGQFTLPAGRYDEAFLERLKDAGATLHLLSRDQVLGLRGTVVTARVNPSTGRPEACEAEGTHVRAEALGA
jgi:gamma-glutamyltranspeptidase/glutathione hydrolase